MQLLPFHLAVLAVLDASRYREAAVLPRLEHALEPGHIALLAQPAHADELEVLERRLLFLAQLAVDVQRQLVVLLELLDFDVHGAP